MQKIIGTVLEFLGLDKSDVQTVLHALASHLSAEAALTVVILLLTVALPIIITRPLADVFDRRAKSRDRAERVSDVTLAAYHEMLIALKAMLESFGSDTRQLNAVLERMAIEWAYFPFYTFDDSEMIVYENYVKKDIAIFPSSLIGATIEFYQASLFFVAYLKDCRNESIQNLPIDRKMAFVRNVHSTAYEYVATCCDTLEMYEVWLAKCQPAALANLRWLTEMEGLQAQIAGFGAHHAPSRQAMFRNLSSKFNGLATAAAGSPAPVRPADELEAST